MNKFEFTNKEKTEIRHNIVPDFLIEVIKLEKPNDYKFGELLFIDDVFDEIIIIKGWHFVFKIKDVQFDISHLRSILKRAGKWYKSQVILGFIDLKKYEPKTEPEIFENEKYILQKSENPNYWVCTDKINFVVCKFENKKYNENQEFTTLENFDTKNYIKLAKITSEMADWLRANHYEKCL